MLSSHLRAEIRDLPTVNVLSTPAFAELLTRLGRDYAREKEITFNLVVMPAGEQFAYLQGGESADLVITTDPAALMRMEYQGMLDIYHRWPLARQPLLLVSTRPFTVADSAAKPEDARLPKPLRAHAALRRQLQRRPLYMGRPGDSPSGTRMLKLLRRLQLPEGWMGYDEAGPARRQPILTLPNGRYALEQALADGDSPDGARAIAWSGDVYALQSRQNPLYIWGALPLRPEETSELLAAVLAGANMKPARELLYYLSGEKGQAAMKEYGLIPLDRPAGR